MRTWTPGPEARARAWAEVAVALWWLTLLAAVGAALLNVWVPPQHLPWKPLRLADPIGSATADKIRRLQGDPAACLAVLREGGIVAEPAPDRNDGGFCVVEDAVRLRSGVTALRPSDVVLRCPLAVGLAVWDRHVLQPAAREALGAGAARVETYGSYACRRVYGSASGRPSEHARANALDVAGVRLEGGGRVTVAGDWAEPDTAAEAAFLRRLRDGGCRVFNTVLGPEYNAAHRDHFHFDMGPYRVCR